MKIKPEACITVRQPTNTDTLRTVLLNHPEEKHALIAARWDHASRDVLEGEANVGDWPDFDELCRAVAQQQIERGLPYGWLSDQLGESPYQRPVRDPSRAAYIFRVANLTDDLFDGYRRYQGKWYEWVGYWQAIDDESFDTRLFNFLEQYLGSVQLTFNTQRKRASVEVNQTLVNAVKLALKAKLRTEKIGWQTCTLPAGIPFQSVMVVGERVLPASADYFDPNPIPHSFVLTEHEPTHLLEMFSTSGVQSDEQQVLQEWAGYSLTRETKYQKLLGLFGVTRSGKGLYTRFEEWLVGGHNYVSKDLNMFAGRFSLGGLEGKLVCAFPDERLDSKNARVALSRFLKIVGGDSIESEKKNKDSETKKLFCKIVIVSNELPELHDESGAMLNRLLIVETRVSHADNEDTDLESKILSQPDELISWALRGLWRLQKQGHFTVPQNGAAEKYMRVNAPIRCFVNECCERGGSVPKDRLFAAYEAYCEDPIDKAAFCKALYQIVDCRAERVRGGNQRVQVIKGISLKGAKNVPNN